MYYLAHPETGKKVTQQNVRLPNRGGQGVHESVRRVRVGFRDSVVRGVFRLPVATPPFLGWIIHV